MKQSAFSVIVLILLGSEDKFSMKPSVDPKTGLEMPPALANGFFSAISFLLGAATSTASGYIGMKIATYANARTALEARKGVAPGFMVGESSTSCILAWGGYP